MEKLKNIFKKIIDLLEKFLTAFFGFLEQIFNTKQSKDINLKAEGKNLESININNNIVNKSSTEGSGFNENPNTLMFTNEQLENLIKKVIQEEIELEQITKEEDEFINTLTKEILPLVNKINKEDELKEVIKKEVREKLDKQLNNEINNPIVSKIITPLIIKKGEKLETNKKDTFLENRKTVLNQKEVKKEDIIVDMPFNNMIGTVPPVDLDINTNKQPLIDNSFEKQNIFNSSSIDNNTSIFDNKENIYNDNSNLDVIDNFKILENNLEANTSDISKIDNTIINNDLESSNITNNERIINDSQIEDDKKKDL